MSRFTYVATCTSLLMWAGIFVWFLVQLYSINWINTSNGYAHDHLDEYCRYHTYACS